MKTITPPPVEFPKVWEFQRFNIQDCEMKIGALMAPIMLKARLIDQIKKMPREAFGNVMGLQMFYNLFTMLDVLNGWMKKNYRWDAQDDAGAKSTKTMRNHVKKDLETRLKIKIPKDSIFNDEEIFNDAKHEQEPAHEGEEKTTTTIVGSPCVDTRTEESLPGSEDSGEGN